MSAPKVDVMEELVAIAKSVGAEIDGGDAPDYSTGYPGYGAIFTFDEKQLVAFTEAISAKTMKRRSPWPNRREVKVESYGRSFVVVTDVEGGISFVHCVYQLVKPGRGIHPIRRRVWPSNPVHATVREVLQSVGADERGVIARIGGAE